MSTAELAEYFRGRGLKKTQVMNLVGKISSFEESKELVYEILGQLEQGITFKQIMQDIDSERFGWDSGIYQEYRDARSNTDALVAKPPEVREGELECPKCHKKKTMIVEMQTRSCDEGFSYEIHCYNPKCKYVKRTDNF